uniref:Ribosomal protein L7/L12 C-terminal domain-containing protein n=1 Tax=Opuntia streptacantha TaxID=393608 RepID=A0A7C8YFY8_OPUST
MSLILTLMRHFPTGFLPKPYISSIIGLEPWNPIWVCRNYAQAAKREEEEEVGDVEVGPRKLPADYDPATFDPTAHRSPSSECVFRLVDKVSSLTLLEATELGSILIKKMGMTESPAMGVLKRGAAAACLRWLRKDPALLPQRRRSWRRLCLN